MTVAGRRLATAVRAGDRRGALQAIADDLAQRYVKAEAGDATSIAKELRAVLAEMAALPSPEGDPVADIAKKRERRAAATTRRQAAAADASPGGRGIAGDGA